MPNSKYHPWNKKHYRNSDDFSGKAKWGGKGKIYFSERRITIEWVDDVTYYVFHTRAAWYIHGDLVEFAITRPSKDGKLAEVRPTRLVKRSEEDLLMRVGISGWKVSYRLLGNFGGWSVRCEINPKESKDGDIFVIRYTGSSTARIVRYFGSEKDPSVMEDIILFRSWVRREWPESLKHPEVAPIPRMNPPDISPFQDALDGVNRLPDGEKLSSQKIFSVLPDGKKRMDLRVWPTMTIDGSDAKDLDDAISIARYEGGDYLLGVHIADVAEYVLEDTDLDREAYLRGTSIYTPGRVIPMLPEILSNDRCSLHPGSPKLTLSILLRVDQWGQVKESLVTESVIESMKKWIYDEVWEDMGEMVNHESRIVNGPREGSWVSVIGRSDSVTEQRITGVRGGNGSKIENQEWTSQHRVATPRLLDTFGHKSISTGLWKDNMWAVTKEKNMLSHFSSLYKILEKRREREGKILFETTECYFDLDEERHVKSIKKRTRNDAHMMIEEFMVLANEEIAKWCSNKKIPFLSRVHEAPSEEKTREIHEIIALSQKSAWAPRIEVKDIVVKDGEITPHDIRSILERSRQTGDLYRLSRLLLPKMAKAVYKESVDRHFGLALKFYAHFTSPIRRYPDLLLHRMIKKYLHGDLAREKAIYEKSMKKWWLSLSEKERAAEDVSRAIDALFMCQYMSDKVGQSFDGMISWLTESNIYVELSSGVEGSIFLKWGDTSISRWGMLLDPVRGALTDRSWKIIYQIGQSIVVKIREVDMGTRRVEMSIG
jgi:exoribonuclease R